MIFKATKLIIPKTLRYDIMTTIHSGHLGIQRCVNRARAIVFWLKMHEDIQKFVEHCSICQSFQPAKPREPLIIKTIPTLPWEIVATDLFNFHSDTYILIVDSYSGFYDFALLNQTTSSEVIEKLKIWFATHGIPSVLESDNGPQFSSKEFAEFAKSWDLQHQTSSPCYPRANGLAERYVQTAKSLLKKCYKDKSDIYLALLNYRNAPRNDDLQSPNQRLMSRVTRSTIPTTKDVLQPRLITDVHRKLQKLRQNWKSYYDNKTKTTRQFLPGDRVRVQRGHRD